jgi:2-methylcitrate dehydratase PrpD
VKNHTPTEELAAFICELEYKDLNDKVIGTIKNTLLDAIACGCYGSTTPWGKVIYEFVRELEGPKESLLWLTHFKGAATNIALALGTCIHAFDFDDYHKAKLHPASVIVPAAITMAEREKKESKLFLTALIAGYETMIRVSLSVDPGASRLKGWHLTGTCGVFGAAAAAGKILGLNKEQMTWALGLAGTQASGLWAFNYDGAMSKRFHPGRASQSGIMAALLAKKGFTGPKHILDAEDGGFWAATTDKPRPQRLLQDLGVKYECEDTCIKPYACCGSNHASVDAVRNIVKDNGLKTEHIKEIAIFTSKVIKKQTGFDYLPETVLQAQMSLKYAVAASAVFGMILPEHMDQSHFSSPALRDLMNKVIIYIDEEMDRLYPEHFCSRIVITSTDGHQYECKIIDPLGSSERPLAWKDVVEKAKALLQNSMNIKQIDTLIETVGGLERSENLEPLLSILCQKT